MSYHLKLAKGLSYCGIVTATKAKPDVYVDDKAIADKAVATGYFKLVEDGDTGSENAGGETSGDDIPDGIVGDDDEDEDHSTDGIVGDDDEDEDHSTDGIVGDDDEDEDHSTDGKTIDKMTVPELETFATYKGVSLKGIRGKDNIIAKLREELGEEAISGIIEYGSPTMVELQDE